MLSLRYVSHPSVYEEVQVSECLTRVFWKILACVLRRILAHTTTSNVDIREHHIARIGDKVVVLRTVSELQVLDTSSFETNRTEQNWTKDVDILSIKIIPCLTVAVECTASVDVHIFATKLEKRGRILEDLIESILLPVLRVVGELNSSLDV
jgi:hypothetical protein